MKTAEEFIQEMENSNVLMSQQFTFKEYVTEALQFQDLICKMVAGDIYHEHMRLDEALFIMESTAREKGLRYNPAVQNGVLTMKKLTKEMAITMSGAKAERHVAKTLEYLNRPEAKIFYNVYVSNGVEETELDGIVLTEDGIIILEVKKVKSDFSLTEDGRMVFAGDECFEKMPLADKMAQKRRLLQEQLQKAASKKGFDIPIYVDSLIVFSAPKGQRIKINDYHHREKYCFLSGLNRRLEGYIGCEYYTENQLAQLSEIFSDMESNVKRFETELNYDEIRRSLAEALAVLQGEDTAEEKSVVKVAPKATVERKVQPANVNIRRNVTRKKFDWDPLIAGLTVAGLVFPIAAILLNTDPHRS